MLLSALRQYKRHVHTTTINPRKKKKKFLQSRLKTALIYTEMVLYLAPFYPLWEKKNNHENWTMTWQMLIFLVRFSCSPVCAPCAVKHYLLLTAWMITDMSCTCWACAQLCVSPPKRVRESRLCGQNTPHPTLPLLSDMALLSWYRKLPRGETGFGPSDTKRLWSGY